MIPQNIDSLLLFQERPDVWTQQQLRTQYGVEPNGTNFYYGLIPANAKVFAATASPFSPDHQTFFATLLQSLLASTQAEKTLVLSLEPGIDGQPYDYDFVAQNVTMIEAIATGLAGFQKTTLDSNKQLRIAIRYASEMNDGPKGGNPAGYAASFAQMKGIMSKLAPSVLMSFSPAIRADLSVPDKTYWPGDDNVDVIGGTWYIGNTTQQPVSTARMQAYFQQWVGSGKPFALSEVGGCQSHDNKTGIGNDAMLQIMLAQLGALKGVAFDYVTIFLVSYWGSDATLKFLTA